MSGEPDYWGRCDTCGDPLTEVGRVVVYSTGAGTLRFRFCDGDCKDRFQNRDVHAEFDRGELVTDGGSEVTDIEQIGVPVGEVADTRPVTDHQSKKVMLRAERKDTILVDDEWTAEVVERQNGYYGPRLTLWSEERGKNYELHGLSFDTGLLLWESVTNEDGYRTGWRKVGEVSAEIAATEPYEICEHCELPIRSVQHERFSALGLCERMEKPNDWGKGTGDETGTSESSREAGSQ